jgi:hypothetical protein
MNSKYIWEIEIPKAIEKGRHHSTHIFKTMRF